MSISHKEAQTLIQFRADDALSPDSQAKLNAHLKECAECNAYSNGLENTVSLLKTTMRKEWNKASLPLQVDALYAKVYSRTGLATILTTRTTLAGAALLLFTFMAWQSVISRGTSQQYPSGTIPLIPTPSTLYTATNTSLNDCQNIKYSIQHGDTLEKIAERFSVTVESILLANNLTETSLTSIQEIIIPVCETTPTSTTFPPTFTTTPNFEPATTIPG